MAQSFKVETAEGEIEMKALSVAEIDTLIADNSPPARKQLMDHMKALGRPVTELLRMKGPERKKYILERYEELGVATGGAGKKAAAKGATVTQIGAKKAAAAAPAAKTVVKSKKAAEAPPEEEETEEEEPSEDGAAGGAAFAALKDLVGQQRLDIAELKELVEAQQESINALLTTASESMRLLLDTHFITRTALPIAAGLSEDDVVEAGSSSGYYGTLLVTEVSDEAAAGNG